MGHLFLLIPPLLLLFLAPGLGSTVDSTLPFSEFLDTNRSVVLRWGFDLVKDSITFQLTVRSSSWVGLGFSPAGGMAGADIVIGGVGPDGVYFTDRFAVSKSLPLVDPEQNYQLLSLTEADGQTVMKFQRSISACDVNDFTITEAPVKLIYAYGRSDNISYHGSQRGIKEVNLLNYMPRVRVPDSKYFDLTMTNFIVPALNTYYHCKILRLPAFDQKYHIYRVEPLIENLDLVHHILLYRCPVTVRDTSEGACYTDTTQPDCYQAVAGWGVGGGAFELPEVAGIPVGDDGGRVLYRLEMHYNNQYETAGRVDNSGLRLYYTAQLRQYDAAVLMTGLAVSPGYAIPPNTSDFLTYGLCDTSHIPQVISESAQDLQVFSVLLHTHLAGRKVRVGQFRKGVQIDFLAINEHYSFEYQQATNLGRIKTVKLGDQLLVECTYDTTNRTEITWGGLSTTNEMCLAFLFYYPAVGLGECVSLPDPQAISAKMGAANEVEWYRMMLTKNWDQNSISEYQQILKRVPQYTAVGNTANNITTDKALIPELKASPSVSCLQDSSEMMSPVTVTILLICLTASLCLI